MAQYTPQYGLHQWEPEDSFLREDFNQDLARIDTALEELQEAAAEKSVLVYGSYRGNNGTQIIELGFRPRALLVEGSGKAFLTAESRYGLTIGETGFTAVYNRDSTFNINVSGTTYNYLALR